MFPPKILTGPHHPAAGFCTKVREAPQVPVGQSSVTEEPILWNRNQPLLVLRLSQPLCAELLNFRWKVLFKQTLSSGCWVFLPELLLNGLHSEPGHRKSLSICWSSWLSAPTVTPSSQSPRSTKIRIHHSLPNPFVVLLPFAYEPSLCHPELASFC